MILTKFSTYIIRNNISHNNSKPKQQHEKDNQQVFECLLNTLPQNTTTNHNQTHNSVQKLEIWSVFISCLNLNTTKLINTWNTTYTSQLRINKRQPTLAKPTDQNTTHKIDTITKPTIDNNN